MRRYIVVLSLLLTALSMSNCKEVAQNEPNPFFEEWTTPYGVPPFDRIKAYHYEPAFERAMSLHNEEIAAIATNPEPATFENTVAAMDYSGRMLSDVSNIFAMMCAAETSEELQALEEKIMPRLSAHSDAMLMNDTLFERVKVVYDSRLSRDLTAEQIRLTELIYDNFVRSGALLDKEQKERLMQINEELSAATVRFGSNILAENNNYKLVLSRADVEILPASVRDAARAKAVEMGYDNKYVFTLHQPSMIPFLTYSPNRKLREEKIGRAHV